MEDLELTRSMMSSEMVVRFCEAKKVDWLVRLVGICSVMLLEKILFSLV